MKRMLAVLGVVSICAGAKAGGYADFGAGIDANNRGEPALASAYFSRALTAGDLPASYIPVAFLGRARASLRQHQCNAAVRDLNSAIDRKAAFADAFTLRAEAQQCLGNTEAALADASQAVHLRPAAGYFFTRSRLYWSRGALSEAHDDAESAAARDPGNAYFRLWSTVTATAAQRTPAQPRGTLTGIGDWPRPLLELYGGQRSPEAVWQAAAGDKGRACEADFYVGAWYAAKGQRKTAKDLYARATATCPRDYVAFDAARSALKRLD
jgi:tetratricopeptide (TPR) repeat protein